VLCFSQGAKLWIMDDYGEDWFNGFSADGSSKGLVPKAYVE
jgi:hypothetical protein